MSSGPYRLVFGANAAVMVAYSSVMAFISLVLPKYRINASRIKKSGELTGYEVLIYGEGPIEREKLLTIRQHFPLTLKSITEPDGYQWEMS